MTRSALHLEIAHEMWPLKQPLTIARGTVSCIEIMVISVSGGGHVGRGECCPTDRFDETPKSVDLQIQSLRGRINESTSPGELQEWLPPGAARNAVDCALWDRLARRQNTSVAALVGLERPRRVPTVCTIGLDEPEHMASEASRRKSFHILKLKLGGDGDDHRVAAVREARPEARLVVDVNEGWSIDHLRDYLPAMHKFGVELIEQPVPAGQDDILGHIRHSVPICADEACCVAENLPRVAALYDAINIKLDKAGGLSHATRLLSEARRKGLQIMIGANTGTSLGVAATMVLSDAAEICDLDAGFWLREDREGGVTYERGLALPPAPGFWGDYS